MRLDAWKRIAGLLWVAAVLGLILREAAGVQWDAVEESVRGYGWAILAIAVLIAVPGYLACATYDLVGRHCTGHDLSLGRTTAISFVGYAFSLNLGALVGGLALRYRLYATSGLAPWKIGQVISLSVITNWLGYVVLAGLLLAASPPGLPPSWQASEPVLRGLGIALLAASGLYLWACHRRGGQRLRWRGRELMLPGLGVAGVQLALSLVSWSAIGAVITWLLPPGVSWLTVMPVLLTSAIVGVLSHVPAGLGVVEATFAVMLGHEVGRPELIGALLMFRVAYYGVPFLAALVAYLLLEATAPERAEARGDCASAASGS